jgi:hypothetical protein
MLSNHQEVESFHKNTILPLLDYIFGSPSAYSKRRLRSPVAVQAFICNTEMD